VLSSKVRSFLTKIYFIRTYYRKYAKKSKQEYELPAVYSTDSHS